MNLSCMCCRSMRPPFLEKGAVVRDVIEDVLIEYFEAAYSDVDGDSDS